MSSNISHTTTNYHVFTFDSFNHKLISNLRILILYTSTSAHRSSTVVKVLCYKLEVAGSIPDGIIGIFHLHNPSDRIVVLGSTQTLTEMSTRSIYWGAKVADA